MKDYVIGVDFGSDSVRAIVVDARNGENIGAGVCEYPRWMAGKYSDASNLIFRQHPQDYLDAFVSSVRGALEDAGPEAANQVRALAIDTTGSTPAPVNEQGVPLALLPEFQDNRDAMFYMWKDHSAIEEAKRINEVLANEGDQDYTRFQGTYSAEWYWAKILHAKRTAPEICAAAASWVEHSDWLPAMLTGQTDPRSMFRNACAAGHKALWHSDFGGLPDPKVLGRIDPYLQQIAQTTAGFTGADLENLMNEAAINAAKSKQGYISQRDIEQSFVKVGIGAEKHSKVISDKEKRITAYHESGHAILFHVLPHESQVHTISIIPTGMGAAGYTMPLPEADEMFMTKKRMEEDIIVAFGGRVAEELIFGDVTTGASQDIKQATATARAMVVKYGMSERLGTINYEDSGEEEVFLGRDLGHARSYSEDVAREIDIEVKRIIDEAYAQAKTIITEHMDVLHRCAQVLIEREKIGNAEFEAIFDGRELPEPGAEQTSLMSGMPSEGR